MANLLLSGPAGGGKSAAARLALADQGGQGVIVDFQAIYAALLGIERNESGRFPEREESQEFVLPLTEFTRRGLITVAVARGLFVIATNSDGNPARRAFLLGELGSGAVEQILDPGIEVVTRRLSTNGGLSRQCSQAIQRWFSRI